MEMTEEQKQQIKKIQKRFFVKSSIAVFLYTSWLFCANILTVMLNQLYFQNQSFVFFATLGSAVIILTGLQGTVTEIHKVATEDIKKITEKES